MSRSDKLALEKIPKTNDKRVIIKSNNEGLGYRLDCYDRKLLGNRISKKEFNKTVSNCTKLCEDLWRSQ